MPRLHRKSGHSPRALAWSRCLIHGVCKRHTERHSCRALASRAGTDARRDACESVTIAVAPFAWSRFSRSSQLGCCRRQVQSADLSSHRVGAGVGLTVVWGLMPFSLCRPRSSSARGNSDGSQGRAARQMAACDAGAADPAASSQCTSTLRARTRYGDVTARPGSRLSIIPQDLSPSPAPIFRSPVFGPQAQRRHPISPARPTFISRLCLPILLSALPSLHSSRSRTLRSANVRHKRHSPAHTRMLKQVA